MYGKWKYICNHSLLYHLVFRNSWLYVSINKVLPDFLYYQLFLSLTLLNITILFIAELFLIILNISNAPSTTYHIIYNSCFNHCLVLFVPIYCINHLLESATPFSKVLLLGRFSCQLHISGLSISITIVSSPPLSYLCHLFTRGNSIMY